jgi:hypothetical protein
MAQATAVMTLAEAHIRGFELVQQHTERFAGYVRGLDEGSLGTQVPGSEWTVGETVAHVQSVYLRYTTDLRRAETPGGVAALNAEDIARLGVDVAAAAATIADQVALLAGLVPHIEADRTFPFHAGRQTTLAGGWGNLLGELLAHGDDIARATGTVFAIPSADTEVLWRFAAPLLEGWLRPEAVEVDDTWLLRFPFGPIGVRFDHGRMSWGAEVESPDVVVDIDDAAEWALRFPYRRRDPDPVTARLLDRFYPL